MDKILTSLSIFDVHSMEKDYASAAVGGDISIAPKSRMAEDSLPEAQRRLNAAEAKIKTKGAVAENLKKI